MNTSFLAGAALLLLCALALFAITAKALGWKTALGAWTLIYGLTALAMTGIMLVEKGLAQ